MVGKTKPATVAEKKRMSLIKEQAWCIPCILNGTPNRSSTTIHHPVSGNKRTGQSMGLCSWHHLGQNPGNLTRFEAQKMLGPSLALSKKAYLFTWGEEDVLVKLQDFIISNFEKNPWNQYNMPRDVQYDIKRRWQELLKIR